MTNSKDSTLLAPQYFKHFQNKGIAVKGFYPFTPSRHALAEIINKGLHKMFPSLIFRKSNGDLLQLLDTFQPNIVLLFKGASIHPQTLKTIAQRKIKLVNYNPDHPFEFEKHQGNQNVVDGIPYFNLYLSYSHRILKQMEKQYPNVKTAHLAFGYSLAQEQYNIVRTEKEINKIGFVGTADKDRKIFITQLLEAGLSIDLYGKGWNRFYFGKKDVKVYPIVKGIEYYKALRRYRVQLNLFRKQNVDAHNMRSFEVPAVGGIMLAPKSEDHLFYFQEDKEIFLFDNETEAIEKAKYLLSLSDEEASQIREQARGRSIRDNHSYEKRGDELLKILATLF